MNAVLITIIVVGIFMLIKKFTNKKEELPVCYHCDSKDTIGYHAQTDLFYCTACNKVLSISYIMLHYSEDYKAIKNGNYEEFKIERQRELNMKN